MQVENRGCHSPDEEGETVFDKLMNSYYYGKSGKGDYTPDDLPKNRWQLFLEMLGTRMSGLCRVGLVYFVA